MSRWVELSVPGTAIAVIVVLSAVVTDRDVRRWTELTGLVPQGDEVARVRAALRRTRSAGMVGAFVGFVVVPIGLGAHIGSLASWLAAGATMTALLVLAELHTHRPRGPVASASLSPRRVEQYLPPGSMAIARGAGLLTMVLAVAAPLIPEATPAGGARPSGALVATLLLAPMLILAVLEGAQRWIVARPQPATDQHAQAIDDAIRARSVHVLAGAALFLEVLLSSVAIWHVGFRRQWEVVFVVAVAVALLGLVASVRVSNRRWTGRAEVAT
jgi:hypothetical protein